MHQECPSGRTNHVNPGEQPSGPLLLVQRGLVVDLGDALDAADSVCKRGAVVDVGSV